MINVHLLTIYKKDFYYCQEVYIGQCKNIYFLQYHNGNGRGLSRRYWNIPTLSFEVANAPLVRRLRLRTSGGHWQPLRMRWVFSNTSSPGLCQCPIVCNFDEDNLNGTMCASPFLPRNSNLECEVLNFGSKVLQFSLGTLIFWLITSSSLL